MNYANFKCRKRLIDKLVEECSEMIYNLTLNDYEKVSISCKIYIVLFVIAFLIIIGTGSMYFYFYWYLKKIDTKFTNINPSTETVIH